MRKTLTILILLGFLASPIFAQWMLFNSVPWDIPKKEAYKNIRTWKIPFYMVENLLYMVDEFNRKFQEKVDLYKRELRARFPEFKDMPDDVILDLKSGMFISRQDYLKLHVDEIKEGWKKNEKNN